MRHTRDSWVVFCDELTCWLCVLQLARHNKELSVMLRPGGTSGEGDEALEFYAKHTAQIEVIPYIVT